MVGRPLDETQGVIREVVVGHLELDRIRCSLTAAADVLDSATRANREITHTLILSTPRSSIVSASQLAMRYPLYPRGG